MATHAEIWLPENPQDNNSMMLLCEAMSDGYLSGVGVDILCSSKKINEISEMSALLAGSPVFFDPNKNIYSVKEIDHLVEVYQDSIDSNTIIKVPGLGKFKADDVFQSAQEAADFIENGNLMEAKQTLFGQIPLDIKLKYGFSRNAEIQIKVMAQDLFSANETHWTMDNRSASEFVVKMVSDELIKKAYSTSCTYFWQNDQFYSLAFNQIHQPKCSLPLILLHSIYTDSEQIADYLKDCTEEDQKSIAVLFQVLNEKNISSNKLFNGNQQIIGIANSIYEKVNIDKELTEVPQKKKMVL